MSLNIQETQRNSIQNLLSLDSYEARSTSGLASNDLWKVLIYDRTCQNLLAPLIKVGCLRQHGVTLNMLLEAQRSPVPNVPAVYLVRPTQKNIDFIIQDMKNNFYKRYYLNFSTPITKDLLEYLAKSVSALMCTDYVDSVVDRFNEFISLSDFEFSLDFPNAFSIVHSVTLHDKQIEECLQKICDGLLCVIVTLGVIPVLRYPTLPTSPCRMLGECLNYNKCNRREAMMSENGLSVCALSDAPYELYDFRSAWMNGWLNVQILSQRSRLLVTLRRIVRPETVKKVKTRVLDIDEQRLKELLGLRETNQLFSRSGVTFLERPLLVLMDRAMDLNVMLHHTWNYQALVHDLFDLRLNRVSISNANEDHESGKPKTFDLDSSDSFWSEYGPRSFVEAAVAIGAAFQEYSNRKNTLEKTNGKNGFAESEASSDITGVQSTLDTLNAVPELIAKKKSIDMHTNLAHAIATEITSRALDKFYELEDAIETGSIASCMVQIERFLDPSEKGTVNDKKRALLCFYIARRTQLTPAHVKKLTELMSALDPSSKALKFLESVGSFKPLEKTDMLAARQSGAASPSITTNWGANLIDRSRGLLQGVRNLLPIKKTYPIERVVQDLMQNKQGSLLDSEFDYIDPKMERFLNADGTSVPRVKTPFKQVILFILGGGSYTESQTIKEMATRSGKQIIYGCTDFVTPRNFLEELECLGAML